MELTSELAHRCLAYVAAVTDQGHRLSVHHFNAYLEAADMAIRPRGLSAMLLELGQYGPSPPSDLRKLGWLAVREDHVVITPLGRAVLHALDQREVESDEPLDIVLDGKDPLAYAQVIQRIAQHDDALLVDPYFKLDHFLHVVQQTTTARLLIGPDADLPGLATALSANLPEDRSLAIRVSNDIHDRYIIPPTGSLDMVGTSLSGVGKGKPSAIIRVNPPTSDAIRQVYEELWNGADPLEAQAPGPTPVKNPAAASRKSHARTRRRRTPR